MGRSIGRVPLRRLESIVPVIRGRDPAAPDEFDTFVVQPLAGSLVALYAFDHGDAFHVVTLADLDALGVDRAALAAAALDNLIDRMGYLEILERPDGCGMLRFDGSLEASALLVTQLWRDIAGILGDEVLVAVPTLDTVLFCAAGAMRNRRALVAARDRAIAVSKRALTADLLRFDDACIWQVDAS
ncbi:MAG: hypothetical protein QOK39_2807 [Acidimicrobiaceae bacterium]|nr:hypothetical protein [Acidimicrobiaceae bacterium]